MTPVQLNRFNIDSSLDLSYLPGASARNGQLFFAQKQVAVGDDPERSKYTATHFIKNSPYALRF